MPNGENLRDARLKSEELMVRAISLERTEALPIALGLYRQAVALYPFNTEAQMQILRIARDLASTVTNAEVDAAGVSILVWGADEQRDEAREFLGKNRIIRIIDSIVNNVDNWFDTCKKYSEDQGLRTSLASFLAEYGDTQRACQEYETLLDLYPDAISIYLKLYELNERENPIKATETRNRFIKRFGKNHWEALFL